LNPIKDYDVANDPRKNPTASAQARPKHVGDSDSSV
jgi:hypothetical protein